MSAKSTLPYEIGRFNPTCNISNRPLEPGSRFVAALIENDANELERVNAHPDAWNSPAKPERVFAYWHATVPEPDAEHSNRIDHDSLLAVFESIEADDDPTPNRLAFRFILALMLQRKRILVPPKTPAASRDPKSLILAPRQPADAPPATPFEIAVPDLDAERLANLTEQLRAVLNIEDSQ
jgi:hypothetical protein